MASPSVGTHLHASETESGAQMTNEQPEDELPGAEQPDDSRSDARTRLGRRTFLGLVGTAGAGVMVTSCERPDPASLVGGPDGGPDLRPDDAAPSGGPADVLRFLNEHQARTVEAITARIIPTDDTPGAVEAGCVFYIDNLLASHQGLPWTAYTDGPHARTYAGDEPPPDEEGVVWVQEDELERYGWQSPFVPRDIYRMGLARLDGLSNSRSDADFVDLTDEDQDALLLAVEAGEDDDVVEAFGELPPGDFFETVRTDTVQGFFADPVYGGNRDMVGWRLVGFPGAQRSFTPEDMYDENFDVTPQSLASMPAFNNDRRSHDHDVPVAVRTRPPNAPLD